MGTCPTCPACREQGIRSEVVIAEHTSDARSVEEKVRFRCPTCGWLSEVYGL